MEAIGWDEELPYHLEAECKKWLKELGELDTVHVPRCLRWPNTVFKCVCLIHHYFQTIYALAPVFSRVKVIHRSIYSRILVRVCAVAMATVLVKNEA